MFVHMCVLFYHVVIGINSNFGSPLQILASIFAYSSNHIMYVVTSLSTVVLNSRDQQGMQHFGMSKNPPYHYTTAKILKS